MIDLANLETSLRERLPKMAFEADVSKYSVDGMTPGLAIRPATAEDVASVLALADEASAAVVPWGAGTQMALGMPPARYDLALDLRGLDSVIEYEPADLTVTVGAGLALSKLQEVLGEHGQWLPLDPPLPESATIGSVLATNASGASRYRYGTARDLLIGITFALPSGELVKSGGRVVKNVAGYDLGKLHIGALGTLGVITQATFKVAPLPARTATARLDGPLTGLMSITRRVADALLAVNGLVLMKTRQNGAWSLWVQFAGGVAAVERSGRELASMASSALVNGPDRRLRGPALVRSLSSTVVARASVVPTAVEETCEALAAQSADVFAYPTAGIVYGAWDAGLVTAEALRTLRQVCLEMGRGAFVLERAPVELKQAVAVWGEPRDDFELMRRLKSELDPKGTLNPGRYLGGI